MPEHPVHRVPPEAAHRGWVRWGEEEAARALATTAARLRARRAARAVLGVMHAMATEGRTPVTALVDDPTPGVLKQYPEAAPVEGRGLFYYYHCHDARETPRGEHGHFHVFARNPDGSHTHLVGVAVDDSGWPLRLFTTNRWVTDEALAPAPRVLALADQAARLRQRDPLARWLLSLLVLFRPQLGALLRQRDARLRALRRGRSHDRLLEDRRVRVLSQCRISLPRQVAALERGA